MWYNAMWNIQAEDLGNANDGYIGSIKHGIDAPHPDMGSRQ